MNAVKKTISKSLLLIFFTLLCFTPVLGQSPTLQLLYEYPLPSIGPNGNQTPLIHVADHDHLIALNYPHDKNLFVYDGNGSILWNVSLPAEQSPWISSVAITPNAQNILLAQLVPACCHGSVTNTSSNKIILFDKGGGKLWEYPTYSPPLASAFTGENENVLIGTEDGRIISLDRQGTLLWEAKVDAPVISLMTSADYNTIVATGESNYYASKLYGEALNPHDLFVLDMNGTLLWNYQTRGTNTALVSDDGSVIAVLNQRSGHVLIFNRTGSLLGERSFAGTSPTISLAGDGSLIVIRTAEGFVYGLDQRGSLMWNVSVQPESQGIALDNEKNVFTGNGRNISLFTKSGKLQGDYPVGSSVRFIYSSPDRKLIVIGTEQKLRVFSTKVSVAGMGGSIPAGKPNITVMNNFQNGSSSVAQTSGPNPAPFSPITCIGALICTGLVVSFVRRDFNE